jgi:hypothetical protein
MPTVTAIFNSPAAARTAISGLTSQGIDTKQVSMLAPGDPVPAEDNKPIKAKVAGGAVGSVLGMGAATFLVPGLGPVVGLGMIAAGLAGAGLGAAAGAAAERTTAGVPNEDLYFYEESLRRGEAIVFVDAPNDDDRTRLRHVLEQAGGVSIDTKRREWWGTVRDQEREHVRSRGLDWNENDYRSGFEAALHPGTRGRSYDQCVAYIETCYPEPCRKDAFRVAFDRGQQYLVSRSGGQVM